MKKLVLYIILSTVILAHSFKTVTYYHEVKYSLLAMTGDLDEEKDCADTESSEEKIDKKGLSEFIYPGPANTLFFSKCQAHILQLEQSCSSFDYNQLIFSPPDHI